jgi:hypothetical protein
MYKASPRVVIPEFEKDEVAAVETVAATEFVSFTTSYQRMRAGRATPTNGPFGEVGWQLADRGRITFTPPTLGGTVTGATLELLGQDADGNAFVLGTSTLASGAFPAIEFDITYERYGLRVAAIAGAGAEVSVIAAAQYFYRAGLATA